VQGLTHQSDLLHQEQSQQNCYRTHPSPAMHFKHFNFSSDIARNISEMNNTFKKEAYSEQLIQSLLPFIIANNAVFSITTFSHSIYLHKE
jgi:hypothetical protein